MPPHVQSQTDIPSLTEVTPPPGKGHAHTEAANALTNPTTTNHARLRDLPPNEAAKAALTHVEISGLDRSTEKAGAKHHGTEQHRPPVDFSKFPEKVVGWRDDHVSKDNLADFVANLGQFKKSGGTHVAFEFLPREKQAELDQYTVLKGLKHPTAEQTKELAKERAQLVDHIANQFDVDDHDPGHAKAKARAEQLMSTVDKIAENGLKIIAVEPPIDGAHRENDGYNFVRSAFEKLPAETEAALRKYMEPGQADEQSKRELTDALAKNGVTAADQAKFFGMLDAMRSSNPPLHLPDGFKLGTQPVEPGAKPTPEQQHQRELWANTTQDWRNATFAAAINDQIQKYEHDPANAHPGKQGSHDAKVMIFAGRYHLEPHKSSDGTTQGTTLDELNKLRISGVALPIRTKLMDPP